MLLTEIIIDFVAALLRIGIKANRQKAFLLSAQNRQQIVRRNPLKRHGEIEIRPVLRGFGIV